MLGAGAVHTRQGRPQRDGTLYNNKERSHLVIPAERQRRGRRPATTMRSQSEAESVYSRFTGYATNAAASRELSRREARKQFWKQNGGRGPEGEEAGKVFRCGRAAPLEIRCRSTEGQLGSYCGRATSKLWLSRRERERPGRKGAPPSRSLEGSDAVDYQHHATDGKGGVTTFMDGTKATSTCSNSRGAESRHTRKVTEQADPHDLAELGTASALYTSLVAARQRDKGRARQTSSFIAASTGTEPKRTRKFESIHQGESAAAPHEAGTKAQARDLTAVEKTRAAAARLTPPALRTTSSSGPCRRSRYGSRGRRRRSV